MLYFKIIPIIAKLGFDDYGYNDVQDNLKLSNWICTVAVVEQN